jgi:competence protein ComEA
MEMRTGVVWALVIILGVAFVFSVFQYVSGHGRSAEAGFVIQGQPRQTLIPAAEPIKDSPSSSTRPSEPPKPAEDQADSPKVADQIVVHVAGAVRRPAVYRFDAGARAQDAIKRAGGAKEDANLDGINLAARLEDGQQLYLPTHAEQPKGGAEARPRGKSRSTGRSSRGHGVSPDKLTSAGQGTVNINTASAAQLQRLPGVGPAMSARIIQFRKENGPFTSTDGLMDVTGIGEKTFERMRPFVRVH